MSGPILEARNLDVRFSTPDGKARLVAVEQAPLGEPLRKWPLTLNTGRYRDHWHTMTRTGLSARLSQHRREPLIELHPLDAEARGIDDGNYYRVPADGRDLNYSEFFTDGGVDVVNAQDYTSHSTHRLSRPELIQTLLGLEYVQAELARRGRMAA